MRFYDTQNKGEFDEACVSTIFSGSAKNLKKKGKKKFIMEIHT